MNSLKLRVMFVAMVVLLVGCNKIDKLGQNDEYQGKTLSHGSSLVLPKDLSDSSMENYYPVPRVGGVKSTANVSTLPPGIQLKK
ncbi:MAG: hypothetical protein KKE11_01550 [Gammaproteobacteria bacterium]|nr:hypothetical protein [Gammaproteobacteria bacterium]